MTKLTYNEIDEYSLSGHPNVYFKDDDVNVVPYDIDIAITDYLEKLHGDECDSNGSEIEAFFDDDGEGSIFITVYDREFEDGTLYNEVDFMLCGGLEKMNGHVVFRIDTVEEVQENL